MRACADSLKITPNQREKRVFVLTKGMSAVGPRPALWSQFDLVAERDLYGANNVRPGLTGWAQINGRDELSIKSKAMRDG